MKPEDIRPEVEVKINSMRNTGQPLSLSSRAFFEPRFGRDFSSVKVRSDKSAGDINEALDSRAVTLGNTIFFGEGQFYPESYPSRKLLAHELTHVVQQGEKGATETEKSSCKKVGVAAPSGTAQRQMGEKLTETSGFLIGISWLRLPKSVKGRFIENALQANLNLVTSNKFPGKVVFGDLWIFVREGLVGFLEALTTATLETKISVADKFAKIMSGNSVEYAKGYLLGLLKGFFIDGLFGIFLAIWELIKGISHLWRFFERVGKLVGGFPDEIQKIIKGFSEVGQNIANNLQPAIEEVKTFLSDPNQIHKMISVIVEHGKSWAKEAGQKIAKTILSFFSKPSAEATVGGVIGRAVGIILFEVTFAVLTAGGGAAVSGVKIAARFVAKIAGKIVGSVLKLFREIHQLFTVVIDIVRASVRFVKGKLLSVVGTKTAKLLEDVKALIVKLLGKCRHRSPLTCDFGKGISIPQGFSVREWRKFRHAARKLAREANLPKGELAVHGSRAKGIARFTSDIDIILRVDAKTFFEFSQARIASARPGTKLYKTLLEGARKGQLSKFAISRQFNQLLKEHLLRSFQYDVDFSIIKIGSKLDTGPFISLGRF